MGGFIAGRSLCGYRRLWAGYRKGSRMSDNQSEARQASDLVILKCPSCGAAEPIEAAIMAEGTQIVVCRRCGETWQARGEENVTAGPIEKAEQAGRSLVWSDARLIDAVRRPLTSYDTGSQDAWAARIAADRAPAPVRNPAGRSFIAAVAALTSIAFLAAFIAGRESAVAAVPDLAGLYDTIGLPVNLRGLAISGLTGRRHMTGEGARLTVSGALVNLKDDDQPVPGLILELRDSAHSPIRAIAIAPPVAQLAGLDSKAFRLVIDDVPKTAVGIAVRFAPSGQTRGSAAGPVAVVEPPQV
jgi:hypothetical protein